MRWQIKYISCGPFQIPLDCPPTVNEEYIGEMMDLLFDQIKLTSSLKHKLSRIQCEIQNYIYVDFD
jgi:hypothetical protein